MFNFFVEKMKMIIRTFFFSFVTFIALNLMNERYRLEIKVLDAEYEGKGRTEPPEFF